MTELTLLMNTTDTALLNGSAAVPVAASGTVAGGFAGVLGKRLMQDAGAAAKETSPQMGETGSVTVAEAGAVQPVDGNGLPYAMPQDTAPEPEVGNPVLDASLLSAIAQGIPAVNGEVANIPRVNTVVPVPGSARAGREGALQSAVSQLAMAQPVTENNAPSALVNATLNAQTTTNNPQNIVPALPNAAQEAQRASASPVIPAMLGRPVSAAAQQALVRASLNADKAAHSLRADMMSATGSVAANTQYSSGLSGAFSRTGNSMGNVLRMDMFATAMSAATRTEVSAGPGLSTTSATPVSLIASGILSDDTGNVLTGMSRIPGATVNGGVPALTVPASVGQPAWASELGQRVTWLANSELREAQLQLNPRSLGAVDVRIVYGPEQQLSVSFSAANPVVRDALDAALPRLREMFEQQGLQLADANISHESPAEREQRNDMGDEKLTPFTDRATDDGEADVASVHLSSSHWLGEGMLDAYA